MTPRDVPNNSMYTWMVGAIVLTAALLMGYGMTADLPYTRMAIERLHIQLALKYGSGDLNPHYFNHPPLLSYCLFALYGISFLAGRLTGLIPSMAAFEHLYFTDPSIFFIIARVFILVAVLGSVVLFFRIAARLFDARSAFIATLCVAWAPELVKWAHYALPTVMMPFLFMAAFFFLVRVFRGGGWRDSVLAGLLGGLAIAAKYDGGAIVLPLVAAHLLAKPPDRRMPRLLASLACVGLGAWVGNPFAPFEARTFVQNLGLTYRVVSGRMVMPGLHVHEPGWLRLIAQTLPFGWGVPLTCLALLGVGYGLVRRRREDLLLLSLILPMLGFVSSWHEISPRYLLTVVPFMVLLGVECCVLWVDRWLNSPLRRTIALVTGTACVVALPLTRSLAFDREVAQPPMERTIKSWIEANLPAGTAIAMMPDLPLIPSARSIHQQLEEIRQKQLGKGVRLERLLRHLDAFPITYDVIPLPLFTVSTFDESDFDFDRQVADNIQYFVLDQTIDGYRADPSTFQVQLRYVEAVQTRCRLLKEFRRPWSSLEPRRSAADEYVQIYRYDQPVVTSRGAGVSVAIR